MGNIIHSKEEFEYLRNLVLDIKENGFDKEKTERILKNILPKDENGNLLVGYHVSEKGSTSGIFYPRYNKITVSISALQKWLDRNAIGLAEMYKVGDVELFKSYLYLMVLTHEIEHSYQFLMGKGIIPAPCKMLEEGYKALTELLIPKDYIIPRPIKQVRRTISVISYKKRENEFLLERNAQFDSLSILEDVAFADGHQDISEVFRNMKTIFACAGYIKNTNGTLVDTFKSIHMEDKLKKFSHDYEDMDMINRYRLGLPVDEETRKKILTLRK